MKSVRLLLLGMHRAWRELSAGGPHIPIPGGVLYMITQFVTSA